MTPSLRAAAALAAFVLVPAAALAADAPDIRGAWTGKTSAIVAGKGGHWPQSAGTFEKPGLYDKDLTITVTGQEGRKFWGSTKIAADGGPTEEPFIGEFMADGKQVLIADTDGLFMGTIEGGLFSFCYAHAGGPSGSSVVSCTEVTKRP